MDGALNRIGEEEQRLGLLANALRQESITEELEIIMLSTRNTIKPD
jgi:F0F1-type ATP synthase gamma subunit